MDWEYQIVSRHMVIHCRSKGIVESNITSFGTKIYMMQVQIDRVCRSIYPKLNHFTQDTKLFCRVR